MKLNRRGDRVREWRDIDAEISLAAGMSKDPPRWLRPAKMLHDDDQLWYEQQPKMGTRQ